jgi:threonylcarbamoyladenosine tRNA methylthiotransferase MtaB
VQRSPVTVAVLTLGCRVNQSESSVFEGTLRHHGVSIVSLEENPEFCIINTCTVTGRSDAASRRLIRKAAKTGAKVIVTGCYSQLKSDEVMGMTGVFQIVPSEHKEKIVNIILGEEASALYHFHDRARPYLKVQDGCDFSCAYCAVPMARGRSRSVPPATAIERANLIDAEGYHEVVLTGIHLGSYGKDLPQKTSLAKLIKNIITRTGIKRIRLSSIEINEVDDELLEVLSDPRVCRHLHLPLQSGSDGVLRRMNRNYSARTFVQKICSISAKFNDIAIGSDVIVGFPGEQDVDFNETYSMINDLPFTYLHIFPYSSRAGTAASFMNPEVSSRVIADRAATLKRLANLKKERFALQHMYKTLDVIMEEKDEHGHMAGTASNYLKIRVSTESMHPGTFVFVRPDGIEGSLLRGFVVT